ncbi:MAG: glycosyltransferase family 2 protein [Candidatus Saganbacteria bacterium]|nr:glycosyltransferase family 2 protein [Candidatus Saganbacteria bacterium]
MAIDISVVIPTVNREKILQKTLEALTGQTYPKDKFEIIVVDDGSTDGTKDTIESFTGKAHSVRYIRQIAGKKGPASANNLGIRSALGEYILFLNDDVIADPNLIEEHMSLHIKHPDIIVQGRVINTSSLEDLGKKHDGYSGGYSDLSFGYFTTWNCSIKTTLLLKAGLFDEDFIDLCWEDVELGYRLRKIGVKQKYNKKAFGYHYKKDFDLKDLEWVKIKSVNMGRNAMIYYRKHPKLDVKISTQCFWLPMGFRGLLSFIVKRIGKEKIIAYLKDLEKRKKNRLLGFLVGLAGYYWYLTGVKRSI